MPTEPLPLLSLSDLRPSHDGRRIAFTINCKGGESAAISCELTEIMDVVAFLLRGAEIATERSGSARPAPKIKSRYTLIQFLRKGLVLPPVLPRTRQLSWYTRPDSIWRSQFPVVS